MRCSIPGGGGVDILAGFVFSPNAIASAPLVTEARVPAVVMNASSAHIPLLSPYIARVSFSTWHAAFPMGRYAHDELGCNRGAIGYSDYSPGVDSGLAFSTGLEAAGGMLVADVPMGGPGEVPDFVPFLRRVIDADPDCLWVFVPAGAHNAALLEAYVETGMRSRGIKLLGPGALTQIARLQQIGDEAVGLMSMHHYSADYDTPANRAFVAAWRQAYGPDTTPGFMAVGGWDGMAAIAHAITAQDGNVTAEGTMEALAGWSFESPRGSITIDPETRDIIHDQHVHEVVPGNPRPTVKVVRTYPQVRDPCKALRVGECE
ncbi:ABC transporter substrate-binding protein [Candidatus Poriferisodalis sp.]|uniref:ABC transporter substrate-binding protein n=1 Tax=Candidatus Poriferisodalis sp. TaxID=3101277 RepID=UPI003B026B76